MMEKFFATWKAFCMICKNGWRRLRPELIQLIQYISYMYQMDVNRVVSFLTERGIGRGRRFFAHILIWTVVGGTIGFLYLYKVFYYPWSITLSTEQHDALIILSLVFFIGCVVTSSLIRSIRHRGVFNTIVRIALMFIIIKGLSLILGWMLTLNSTTPMFDEVIASVAKSPDWCLKILYKIWSWIIEKYNLIF